mmetsp:Transcript_11105/g.34402  ORF Transcript_11105/g.34402 Transcript_11105/m.34402 type:complete len:347 (+) Transcript_11105:547-1587(+)
MASWILATRAAACASPSALPRALKSVPTSVAMRRPSARRPFSSCARVAVCRAQASLYLSPVSRARTTACIAALMPSSVKPMSSCPWAATWQAMPWYFFSPSMRKTDLAFSAAMRASAAPPSSFTWMLAIMAMAMASPRASPARRDRPAASFAIASASFWEPPLVQMALTAVCSVPAWPARSPASLKRGRAALTTSSAAAASPAARCAEAAVCLAAARPAWSPEPSLRVCAFVALSSASLHMFFAICALAIAMSASAWPFLSSISWQTMSASCAEARAASAPSSPKSCDMATVCRADPVIFLSPASLKRPNASLDSLVASFMSPSLAEAVAMACTAVACFCLSPLPW